MTHAEQRSPKRPTVLVAEDEEGIRNLVRRILETDYEVLIADDGAKALELSRSFSGSIELLLSDVQMPGGLLGTELAQQIRQERPNVKVVLMSGFTGGLLVLDEGWEFIEKPFIPTVLRRRLAVMLANDRRIHEAADSDPT